MARRHRQSRRRGRKFIPVTVDSVAAGNSLFPVKVAFTDPEGRSARIFIHPGAKGDAPRTFSRVFSFTDPRIQYPHITPEHWQLIIDGRVTEGMTSRSAVCHSALLRKSSEVPPTASTARHGCMKTASTSSLKTGFSNVSVTDRSHLSLRPSTLPLSRLLTIYTPITAIYL